jgi:hypothetical protein
VATTKEGTNIIYGLEPTVDLGPITTDANTISGIGYTYTTPNTTSNGVWTTVGQGVGIGGATYTISNTVPTYAKGATIDQSGTIGLRGKGADIDINGKSLVTWMEKVEQQLNIMTPNPELEEEWEELKKLGERYRKLEKKCQEKAEVWKKLKSMPKVEK